MDFTFSDEQDALRDAVRAFLADEAPPSVRAGDGRRRARRHRRRVGRARRARLDRRCSCPRSTAGAGSAWSTWSSCSRRWAGVPFPGPVLLVRGVRHARRRAGSALDDQLASLAAGATARHGRARGARPRRPGRPGPHPGHAARAAAGALDRAEAGRARRPHRRLGARRRPAPQDGLGTFLVEAPGGRARARRGTSPARSPGSSSTTAPAEPRRPRRRPHRAAGGASSTTRRSRCAPSWSAAMRAGARAGRRVRQGAGAVRPADRHLPGRSSTRPSTCSTALELARVGTHYAAWASDVDDPRAGARPRRWPRASSAEAAVARHRREHPDPRRRRLHLGLRRPPALPPGQAERPAPRLPGLAAPAPRRPRPRRLPV